jgi:hypothetical protein
VLWKRQWQCGLKVAWHLIKFLVVECEPPQTFPLHKEGRHWIDDNTNQDLLDELGKAIEIQVFGTEQVSNPRRSSEHGRPR